MKIKNSEFKQLAYRIMSHIAKGLMYEHKKHRNTSGNNINHKNHSDFSNLDVVEIDASDDNRNNSNDNEIAEHNCARQAAEYQSDFPHLKVTRKHIQRAIALFSDVHAGTFNKCMSSLIRQYDRATQDEFESASHSPLACRKLARILLGLCDLIHTIARKLINTAEYKQRMCNIVAHYIACELCAAQEPVERSKTIIQRISSALHQYVADTDAGQDAYKDNVLRTLVIIPKLFNRAAIITALYSNLFPQWSNSTVIIQAEQPDKVYIMYLILFYNWRRLETDPIIKERIVDFADKYMRPSRSLITNVTYSDYLPKYTVRRSATRYILEHLNEWECINLRIVSKLDNRLPQSSEVDLTSDDEDLTRPMPPLANFMTLVKPPGPAPEPPDFLHNLLTNARKLEPCKRAELLFSGIDSNREIVELSDDEVEMFSLDFNVPANVDGNPSNDASNTTPLMDDEYVPITRIYPTNLRTYERATSQKDAGAASSVTTDISTTPATDSATATTYTMPRIVNSYSCRLDSIHMVTTMSTSLPQTLLVDQCVQTADGMSEIWSMSEDDNLSNCVLYSDTMLPASQSSAATEVLYATPLIRHSTHMRQQSSHSGRLACGTSTDSSETSLNKKQVTFSPQHLDAQHHASSSPDEMLHTSSRPVIEPRSHVYDISSTSLTPNSSDIRLQSLKWLGRKEHLQAGQRMFVKHETNNCDKNISAMPARLQPTSKQKYQTNKSQHTRKRKRGRANDVSCSSSKKPTRTSPPSIALTPMSSHKSTNDSISTPHKTPTSSNASSRTSKNQSQMQRHVTPTPPASTHSSLTRKQRQRSSDTEASIDMQELEIAAKDYKFDRRQFAKIEKEHVSFYNALIRSQRKLLQQRRREAQNTQHKIKEQQAQQDAVENSERNDQADQCIELIEKQRDQLRRTNIKLRTDAEYLNEQLDVIKRYVSQFKETHFEPPTPVKKRVPKIRLKRINLKDYLEFSTRITMAKASEECHPPQRQQSQQKEVLQDENKLQQQQQPASQSQSQSQSKELPDSTQTNVKKRRRRRKLFVPKKNRPRAKITQVEEAEVSAEQTIANLPTSRSESPDLCIAAYVTLTANGVCCDETQAKVSSMLQVQDTIGKATNALDIELATSNVPVYLLNGESRDVPTPTSLGNETSPLPSEMQTNNEQLRRMAIANYLELQRTGVRTSVTTGLDKYGQRKRSETVDVFGVTVNESDSFTQLFKNQQRRQTFGGHLLHSAQPYKSHNNAVPGFYTKNIEYSLPIRLSCVAPPRPPATRKRHRKKRIRRLNC